MMPSIRNHTNVRRTEICFDFCHTILSTMHALSAEYGGEWASHITDVATVNDTISGNTVLDSEICFPGPTLFSLPY